MMRDQHSETVAQAEQLGRQAFEGGAVRAPALDSEMVSVLGGTVGENALALTAWLRGWDQANLAD